VILQSIWMYV